jgi:hypothetical protein
MLLVILSRNQNAIVFARVPPPKLGDKRVTCADRGSKMADQFPKEHSTGAGSGPFDDRAQSGHVIFN